MGFTGHGLKNNNTQLSMPIIEKESHVIICTISKIISQNDTGFFTGIAYLNKSSLPINQKHKNFNRGCSIIGINPNIASFLNYEVECFGEWVENSKYGSQFSIEYINDKLPTSKEAITAFLTRGKIHGIGKATAKIIVELFKEKTFTVFSESPNDLLQIKGITESKLKTILTSWDTYKETHKIMSVMFSHKINPSAANKIYTAYKDKAIDIIEQQPYSLINIQGIGFRTADGIAKSLGIRLDSSVRIKAGINFTINEISKKEGHTAIPTEYILLQTSENLELNPQTVFEVLTDTINSGELISNQKTIHGRTLTFVTNTKINFFEKTVAEILISCNKNAPFPIKINNLPSTLDISQSNAIHNVVNNKISILTGGPGTGKTYTIKNLLDIFQENNLKVVLCAPTGRAAKRMSESTGHESKTIHRLLSYREGKFIYDQNNKLKGDVFIIDESSMIDIYLAFSLIRAIPKESSIIFVGDINQLPSVGVGNFFEDIIRSNLFKISTLTNIHRQKGNSGIITNAHKIINQSMPTLTNDMAEEFVFLDAPDNDHILARITEVFELMNKTNHYSEIQILCPQRTGLIGTESINKVVHDLLIKDDNSITMENGDIIKFSVGDKVMQTKNNYDLDVYNGDIGIVADISKDNGTVSVDYDDNIVVYPFQNLRELTMAYAITVHKSQGSEYPIVILPISKSNTFMLNVNILYTAVTRSKKKIFLIGNKETIYSATKIKIKKQRNTFLVEELNNYFNENNKETITVELDPNDIFAEFE